MMDSRQMLARTRRFALEVISVCDQLPNKLSGWVLGKQLIRSGTSIGANYSEAQRARTKTEFHSKIQICRQEIEETVYWLELLLDAGLMAPNRIEAALAEAQELRGMFTAIALSLEAKARGFQ